MELTQKILKELLHYNDVTGVFTWRERGLEWFSSCKNPTEICGMWNTRYSNITAGSVFHGDTNHSNYTIIVITLCGKRKNYKAHRLAYLYMEGKWPKQVDHEDHDGLNNKWSNLKDVTNKENQKNVCIQSNNKSGFTGVSWNSRSSKWHVQVVVDYKRVHGGYFAELEDAIEKRKQMNIEHNFHENHGK